MAHFLCHLGCSHFGALLLDFYFTENRRYLNIVVCSNKQIPWEVIIELIDLVCVLQD